MKKASIVLGVATLVLTAQAVEVAVMANGRGKHHGEFTSAFNELGWTEKTYFDTEESMAELAKALPKYDFILMSPLWAWKTPGEFKPDPAPLRAWIEKGGVLVVTDGSYDGPREFLAQLDKRLGGLVPGKCTSSQWQVLGYTSNVEPVHTIRAFPNLLTDGDCWPHFDAEPPAGSPWQVVTRCSEGKPVILYAEFGKGAILLSALRQQAAKAIENYYAFSQLKKSGLSVKDFRLSELRPGPGAIAVTLAAPAPAGTKLVYEIDGRDVRGGAVHLAFEAPFEGLVAATNFDISVRGPVTVTLSAEKDGARAALTSRKAVLPQLVEVGANAYRGILSTKRRTPGVKFPVRFAPDTEDLSGAKLTLSVWDALSNEVSSAEFTLPTNGVPREAWYEVPLRTTAGAGGYRVDANLYKPGVPRVRATIDARSSASFEILVPQRGQCIIDEDGTFLLNGTPFFPLGMYHAHPDTYETLRDVGFNTIQFWNWFATSDAYGNQFNMDRALGNGLHCLYESNRHFDDLYRKQMAWSGWHPAMLMWYLADEPTEGMAAELRHRNALRHELDKQHPTYVCSCRPDLFAFHASFADVFAMDATDDGAALLDWCRRAQREVMDHKPVVAVPVADCKNPDDIPLRVWVPIVHGVRGIIWYCWTQMGGGPSGIGLGNHPEKHAIYKKVLARVKTVLPALYSTVRRPFEAGDVHGIVCGTERGKRYAILVNVNEAGESSFEIELPEMKGWKNVLLVPEGGKDEPVTLEKPGVLAGKLAPREVRIWRW